MKRLWITLALATVGQQPAITQSQPSATTKVRLQTESPGPGAPGGRWIVGYLDQVGRDTMRLRLDRTDGPLIEIDRGSIRRLETSAGRRRHPGRGALWGAGAGLGLGLLALTALDHCAVTTGGWSFDICRDNEGVVVLGSVVAGAAWGAVVGLLITSDRWVPMPGARFAPVVTRDGLGLALRLPLRRHRQPALASGRRHLLNHGG